jgi:hypothetical protein
MFTSFASSSFLFARHMSSELNFLILISCDYSILGGIGTVLDWWPIKAYRPCPNFIERGGRYVRSGQGLDEIAFGRDSTFQSDE